MVEVTMIADRYRVISSIGQGGMADVYLAHDIILNRDVAIKILRSDLNKDPRAVIRFQREASAVSKLHHPNVVEVYDAGEYQNKKYMAMEYVKGKTLKQLISQRGPLSTMEAISIMKQLASAIEHAHSHDIIHRDIKPQNILLKDDGTVKITDFGIAKDSEQVQLTQTDSVLGSAHYIAPETTRGETPTNQIDIYALGIVFYELLVGKVPFNGENPVQIAMMHLQEEIPSVCEFNPMIPQSVENIIIKATAKNKINRYKTAKEMLDDLNVCLDEEHLNDEKIYFEKIESPNEKTVVFTNNQNFDEKKANINENEKNISEVVDKKSKSKNKVSKKMFKFLLMMILVLVLVFLTLCGIYYSGFIDGFHPAEYVKVPKIEGKTTDEARRILQHNNLELDEDIEKKVTDNDKIGTIIDQKPNDGEKIKEGTKIKIIVCSGNYYKVNDYRWKYIGDVENELEEHNVSIEKKYVYRSDVQAGVVVEQSGMKIGDKLDPNKKYTIKLTVASYPNFSMDNYTGMGVNNAKSELEKLGAHVQLKELDKEELSKKEKNKVKTGVVVKQSTPPGAFYEQKGDNIVILYYYKK